METVTISPKYQVVIPKGIRESLELRPGQKVQAILYDRRIELVPVRPIAYERSRFMRMARVVRQRPKRDVLLRPSGSHFRTCCSIHQHL
jgi:AbrB family looped-hinge helix DNA binding protein